MYSVPKSTLGDHISGRVLPGRTSGPALYLSREEEEEPLSGCSDRTWPYPTGGHSYC